MHFKKLELFGFKSFAEKTKLHFGPGVTVIVGPNGCGKSNLADAIKWVLGEQSPKALRGGRMEDVIFNGTDSRPSLGMAEVSLTLANSSRLLPIDYEEVTVARRIFRSGESLYFLNKTPCRLKDIVELFMGTGVGTSAYSLLEQGQIDLILSSKPEDRRFIFEEAAGITKYKAKKKEALNKLEQTEANLVRINDIMGEVRRQIGSIERQAKKAQRYKEEFERLKDLETKVASVEYKKIKDQLGATRDESGSLAQRENSLTNKIADHQSKIESLHRGLETLESNLATRLREETEIVSAIDKDKHLISLNEERIGELGQQRKDLGREIELITQRISDLKGQSAEVREKLTSLSNERQGANELLAADQKRLSEVSDQIKTHQQNISNSKNDVILIASELAKAKNELVKVATNLQNATARKRRLEVEKGKVRKEWDGLSRKVQEVSSSLQQAEVRADSLKQRRSQTQSRIKDLEDALTSLTQSLQSRRNESQIKASKVDLLRDLKKSYVGFKEGPRSILMGRDEGVPELRGVLGPVCDLIKMKPGYEKVIEAALGEHAQSIVVDSIASAKGTLSYLKSSDLGRATILSKDMKLGGVGAHREPRSKGVVGKATDFVDSDPQVKDIVSYLLKDTIVVKDLSAALGIDHRGWKLVTLDGEVVGPGGEITGGSKIRGRGEGLIGRESQIQGLEDQISQLKAEIARDERRQAEAGAELAELKEKDEEIETILREEELKCTSVRNELNGLKSLEGKLGDEMALLALELGEVNEKVEELGRAQVNWERRLEDAKERDAEVQNLIISSQRSIVSKRSEREEFLVEIARSKTEFSSFEERESSFDNTLRMLETSYEGETSLLKSRKEQIKTNQKREEKLISEIERLKDEVRDLASSKIKIQKSIPQLQSQRQNLKGLCSQEEAELKRAQSQLDEVKDRLHLLEVNQTELSYEADAVKGRILQAYKVDLETISIPSDKPFEVKGVSERVAEIKSRLERIGPVNLVAIEEHEELKERLGFLAGQQRDLEEAKRDLHRAIRKINRTTRRLFMETFSKIQVTFKELFGLLFEGGSAELILTDESDVLECGIEIVAQPPGKKLQNISLLSGGEKALTAVALLFAIFKVKPSPFCVLDEIDGPLDEANIDRFTKVLGNFVKASQFIIITHNKKTIAMADVIYGVTMEESGISKLVSVKLTGKELQKGEARVLSPVPQTASSDHKN